MHAAPLFRPPVHGAVGPWDEIVSLIPVVIGAVLLLYLYFSSRRPADGDGDDAAAQDSPGRPPE